MPPVSEPLALRVEHLTIRFRTTKESSKGSSRNPMHLWRHSKSGRTVTALDDVSFEVGTGQVFGVIGHNGAGKSTLFRALAGILPPDEGRITAYGRVTPLLSLGMGFNRELTGRDNILLGGLIAGLEKEQIDDLRQPIIDFADLGDAIDYPMRTYSNGMFSRLGFALAAHLDPEIILIDEALAAGDASFKEKCQTKIQQLCESECTVLVVSHGLVLIKRLASKSLWLDAGKVCADGDSAEVVDAYLESEGVSEEQAALDDF